MATTATLSLILKIGSAEIPIQTPIPPKTGMTLKFSYELDSSATTPTYIVSVEDFFSWASGLGFGGAVTDLPEKLRSLSVGIQKIEVDTDAGNYDAAVIFGKKVNEVWDPSWTPIDNLSLSFKNVTLEVDRVPDKT
jgi:hypothetical protein